MKYREPFRREYDAIVDARGRICVPGYEQRGEQWNGTNPPIHPMSTNNLLFIPPKKLDPSLLEWIRDNDVDAYSPHVDMWWDGPRLRKRYSRMDRHFISDYGCIEWDIENVSAIRTAPLVVGIRDYEDFIYAQQRFL
jgi:hypothetical protein